MLLLCATSMARPSEAEPRWVEGRWHVATETVDNNAPLLLALGERELVTPAWQVEAVIDCRPKGRPKKAQVACDIEAASVRLVTYDHWQRPADRQVVDAMLGEAVRQLVAMRLLLRNPDSASVVARRDPSDPGEVVHVLFDDVIDAFAVEPPKEGFVSGARWRTSGEPLLDIAIAVASRPVNPASHGSRTARGQLVIDTSSEVDKPVLTPQRGRFAFRSPSWRKPDVPRPEITVRRAAKPVPSVAPGKNRRTYPGQLVLRARSTIALDPVRLMARGWTVTGRGAVKSRRAGRLRRLGEDEVVDLGPTRQVADADVALNPLPTWISVLESR